MYQRDFNHMLSVSIDRSVCYLERNIFAHGYGQRAQSYIAHNSHTLSATERFLHKQVRSWQLWRFRVIHFAAFPAHHFPSNIAATIRSFI